jgi:GNAT superfamily N-acetyltransferase
MPTHHVIRDVRATDRTPWQELWEQYLVFYEADLPADRTEFLWHRILDPGDPVSCIVAEVDGAVVGIAHYFPHENTWEDGPVCYLQDLYVAIPRRRTGVAQGLIREIHRRCRDHGWRLLYWTTRADNTVARILYDGLTGGTDGHVVYKMEVPRS